MCPRNREASGLYGVWHCDDTSLNDPWGLVQAFHVLDRDGDGTIKTDDLSAFFGGCLRQSISTEEATSMIALADLDGDGAVGLEEFQQLMAGGGGASLMHKQQAKEQAVLREVFDVLDVNKDGMLGRGDLRHAMAMSGHHLSEEELDAMVGVAARLQAPGLIPAATITFDIFAKLMSPF